MSPRIAWILIATLALVVSAGAAGQVTKIESTVKHRPTFIDADFGQIATYLGELTSRTFELEPGVCALVTASWDKPLSSEELYRAFLDIARRARLCRRRGRAGDEDPARPRHAERPDAAVSSLPRAQRCAELATRFIHSGVVPMVRVLVWACFMLVSGIAAAQSQPTSPHTLYLIRHGAYVADRNADPQLGPGITPLGVAQARLIAARLSAAGVSFDSMTSSTLQRARDTAAVMHETLVERACCTVSAAQRMHTASI